MKIAKLLKMAGPILFFALLMSWIAAPASEPVRAEVSGGVVITVNTTADLANSTNYDNHTCSYTSGAIYFPAGDGQCTLRRAILEAGVRPDSDRPISIQFNIPTSDSNYNASLQIWEVQIDESYIWELDRRFITDDGGQVTIDGNTQPNGRTDGPKIMVNTNRDNSELFGSSLEVRTSNNIIRNLGFIGGGQIILYEGGNTIENNWMGLTADGTGLSLASDASTQAMRSMARGGIIMPNEASDNNIIQNNRIIGAFERAIRITSGGDNNLIQNNFIGMNADGLVPAPFNNGVNCTRELDYNASFWYGGRGIQVTGSNNTIINNRIAGLHIPQSTNDTPPITMEISGDGHTVTGNVIGRDVANNNVGVCGQGMLLQGTEHLVELNTIVHSRNGFEPNDDGTDFDSAILTQSFAVGSNHWITVRKNTILDADQATHPDHAYRFASPGVPVELRQFNPAKVTSINGTTVSGTRGDDAVLPGGAVISAACPNCTVYLYADDLDGRIEAHEFLGEATANSAGNWTATLSRPLAANEGLRTQSMANGNGVIHIYGAGTTSKLSDILYLPPKAPTSLTISGPTSGVTGTQYGFNITINPADVSLPIDVEVTGDVTASATLNDNEAVLTVTFNNPGSYSFTVTATNGVGSSVMDTHSIEISEAGFSVYLPMVVK
ncbi:MAG: PKD domain-containing protein [Ardenticatenaceae bacterium]|nr:PKD domain-containing protein [Ardenticatenaceae bacterium]MCB8947428.1 PKD domain-containing protein [Ardenticatenaceae bacterium]